MRKGGRSNPWVIVALLFFVALVNYFDRQSLSVVAPQIQSQLHLSDSGYGHIVSLFLLASAFAYALSGFLCDAIGTRKSMAIFVAFWSAAEAATAFATSAITLGIFRFCLGLGEPGLWVAAPKAVRETVEPSRRSLAVGIYTAGATVGAIIAIPIILAITSHLPWKTIFLLDGAAGLLWVPVWLWLYRDTDLSAPAIGRGVFRQVLARPQTWQFMIARALTDPLWYFYLFWFPKFLLSERHLSTAQLAHFGWIVYLAGGVGTIAGGLVSGGFIRRGMEPGRSYRLAMCFSVAAVLCSPLAYFAQDIGTTMLFASIVAMAHMAWLINLTSALLEIFPPTELGKGVGLVASGSALGGMVSSEIIGYFVTHGGYRPVFFLMACMHPIAICVLWTAFRTKQAGRVSVSPEQETA